MNNDQLLKSYEWSTEKEDEYDDSFECHVCTSQEREIPTTQNRRVQHQTKNCQQLYALQSIKDIGEAINCPGKAEIRWWFFISYLGRSVTKNFEWK